MGERGIRLVADGGGGNMGLLFKRSDQLGGDRWILVGCSVLIICWDLRKFDGKGRANALLTFDK